MKKNIGSTLALYPTPMTVVGVYAGERVNWIALAHVGIWNMGSLTVSSSKKHFSNELFKQAGKVSVNLVSPQMIPAADYVGIVSGAKVDKTDVFACHAGELGTPVIDDAPLSMECKVTDVLDAGNYDVFVLEVVNTYVDEENLNGDGIIDYQKVRPVLFEMPTHTYLATGETVGHCWSDGKGYR